MATRIRRIIAKTGSGRQAQSTQSDTRRKPAQQSSSSGSGSEDDDEEAVSSDSMSDVDNDDVDNDSSELSDEMEEDEGDDADESEDGESLLGSADSDDMQSDLEEEEERFIIEDLARRRAKVEARRRQSENDGSFVSEKQQRIIDDALLANTSGKEVSLGNDPASPQREADDYPDDASGSLSPETLRQLGLDEYFEGPDGIDSSSEPSFTDFFDDSSSEDGTEDGIALEARSDDLQLTTDDEDSETDISDLEDGLLSAPMFADALAAGAATQHLGSTQELNAQADIPLLVIEDLDGRLIYARAGDGEAVFGSDGEFEYVDDSEEDDYSDADSDLEGFDLDDDDDRGDVFGMDDVPPSRSRLGPGARRWRMDMEDETDEGDTTDELPNEDMPFPRLLVGSVAPYGGRNARRARALAARSRKISPNIASQGRKRSTSAADSAAETGNGNGAIQDVGYSILTEDLARDPQATLQAAAQQLGLTIEEVAQLVIGMKPPEGVQGQAGATDAVTPVMNNNRSLPAVITPEHGQAIHPLQTPRMVDPPRMGSFMPTSSKSVHRAVIDGSRQAPSPFTGRFGTQRKGLASRKRANINNSTPSIKRARRDRSTSNAGTAADIELGSARTGNGAVGSVMGDDDEEDDAMDVEAMGLEDVMDTSMIWRNSLTSSPPSMHAEPGEGTDTPTIGKKSPSVRSASHRSSVTGGSPGKPASASSPSQGGLNLSAVARWHRIPMGAFREGQVSGSSNKLNAQPLGSFLLTRSRDGGRTGKGQNALGGRIGNVRGQSGSGAEHSPFRGRARGASIHLNEAPPKPLSGDAFMVSPVLWPSRHGSSTTSKTAYDSDAAYSNVNGNGPSSQSTAGRQMHGEAKTHKGQIEIGGKTMMTRREKRERKARKAALKSALRSAAERLEGGSKSLGHEQNMPQGFLPDFNVTDASPRASPKSQVLPLPPKASKSAEASTAAPGAKSTPIDIPASSSAPSSYLGVAGEEGAETAAQAQHSSQPHPPIPSFASSNSSSSMSSQHQPPSSVFGMPLHSPLFGSILNPPNLGFRDDLDERDEEGVLTI